MRDLRVASVQFQHQPGDKHANLNTIRRFVEEAARQKVELAVFPEMCITGYWHVRNLSRNAIADLAEPVPEGPATRELLSLARQHRMTIGAGLIEATPEGKLHNTYVVAMPDGHHVRHRKLHTFISEHMESGNEFTVFDTPHGCRVGILTCYDNNLGENVRINALMGAEILLAPHQTGGCDSPSPSCMGLIDPALWFNRENDPAAIEKEFRGPKGRQWLLRWLPARAHDNGLFLIFSNGVGFDDGEVRTGNAMILDPYGEIISETWEAKNTIVVADLKADRLKLCTGRRWIRSRRPQLYGLLVAATGRELDIRTVRFAREE